MYIYINTWEVYTGSSRVGSAHFPEGSRAPQATCLMRFVRNTKENVPIQTKLLLE